MSSSNELAYFLAQQRGIWLERDDSNNLTIHIPPCPSAMDITGWCNGIVVHLAIYVRKTEYGGCNIRSGSYPSWFGKWLRANGTLTTITTSTSIGEEWTADDLKIDYSPFTSYANRAPGAPAYARYYPAIASGGNSAWILFGNSAATITYDLFGYMIEPVALPSVSLSAFGTSGGTITIPWNTKIGTEDDEDMTLDSFIGNYCEDPDTPIVAILLVNHNGDTVQNFPIYTKENVA